MTQQVLRNGGKRKGCSLSGASGLVMPLPWDELRKPAPSHLLAHVCLNPCLHTSKRSFPLNCLGQVCGRQPGGPASSQITLGGIRTNLCRRENQTIYNLPRKCNNLFLHLVFVFFLTVMHSFVSLKWFGAGPCPIVLPREECQE